MLVDEVLRRSHAEANGPPTLRLYQWSQPTLSLGAGQPMPASLTPELLASLNLAVVRRPTGGRAVLHCGDLTYCFVAGVRDGFPPSITATYQRLNRALQRGLANFGLATSGGRPAPSDRPGFSCFARLARGDLAWGNRKLVGSAQSWQGESFLQHGTILLTPQQDSWWQILGHLGEKMILPIVTLAEILGGLPPVAELKQALRRGFAEELGVPLQEGDFTPWEREMLDSASGQCGRGEAARDLPGSARYYDNTPSHP